MLESIVLVAVLVICVSYMFLGCAGHRRKTGDEQPASESTLPEDQQMTPSQAEQQDQAGGSKIPTGESRMSNADQSIAGYQSQTSEILAGPGEVPNDGLANSTISRPGSHLSHTGSKMHSQAGSTLSQSHHGSSHHPSSSHAASSHAGSSLAHSSAAQSSKFGSTMDSSLSRAAGGGPASVLSVMSRHGASNIQSSLSSTPSRSMQSRVGSSNIGSGITSNYQSGVGQSGMGQSSLDSSANAKSRASNIASNIMRKSQAKSVSSKAKNTASNVSRVLSSSVAVSGSSPVSTGRSASGSPMSTASVTTPQSSSSSRQSSAGK